MLFLLFPVHFILRMKLSAGWNGMFEKLFGPNQSNCVAILVVYPDDGSSSTSYPSSPTHPDLDLPADFMAYQVGS